MAISSTRFLKTATMRVPPGRERQERQTQETQVMATEG